MNGFGDMSKALGIDNEEEELKEDDIVEVKTIEELEEDKNLDAIYNTPPIPNTVLPGNRFEDNYKFDSVPQHEETNFQEVKPYKQTGGIKMEETNLIFEGDNFLTELLDKDLYTTNQDTLSIPLEHKELYKSKVDVENVEQVIESAFASNPKRVSFALEEIGLHNRLIEMADVIRKFDKFTLIKTDKGNVVVHHTQNSLSDIEKEFMEEAKACLKEGKRIIIPLLEDYEFEDGLGLVLSRKKFRASFSEIKNFISRTQMKGTITKDAMLVIYE